MKLARLTAFAGCPLRPATQFEQQRYQPITAGWLADKLLLALVVCLACVVAVYSPVLGLAAVVFVLLGAGIHESISAVVLIFAFLVPFDLQFRVVGQRPVYLDLAFAMLTIPLLRNWAAQKSKVHWFSFSLLPFVVFAVLSTYGRTDNTFWLLVSALRYVIAIGFIAAVATYAAGEKLVLILGSTLIPLVLYGVYQLVIGDLGPLFYIFSGTGLTDTEQRPWMDRSYSVFSHPNAFGSYCSIVSCMLLAVALRTAHRGRASVCWALATVGLVGALASGSRGAWIAGATGIALILFFGRVSWTRAFALVGAVGFAIYLAVIIDLVPLFRASGVEDFIKETRLELWGAAIVMFLQHPVIGVGFMNFSQVMPTVINWDFPDVHAHSIYLQVLAETGTVGFLLFYVPVVYLLYRNLRAARANSTALVAAVGLTVTLVHGTVEMMFYSPQNMLLFAAVLGLSVKALSALPQGETPAISSQNS